MGTHPIFESDFDCLTEAIRSVSLKFLRTMSSKLDAVPKVRIDEEGVYKYIQIKLTDPTADNASKIVIRGFSFADYHADILDQEQPGLEALGLSVRCIGGGRISKNKNQCTVYGYSIGFGRPDHSIAADAIQEEFPDLKVDWNDEGY